MEIGEENSENVRKLQENKVLVTIPSKHGLVLRICFPDPCWCNNSGWACFKLHIALSYFCNPKMFPSMDYPVAVYSIKHRRTSFALVTVHSLNSSELCSCDLA